MGRLYYALFALTAAVLVVLFVVDRKWVVQKEMKDHIHAHLWAKHGKEEFDSLWASAVESPLCKTPERFDYRFDQEFAYTRQSCLPICTPKIVSMGYRCLPK